MNGCEIVCPRSSGSGESSNASRAKWPGTNRSRGTERIASSTRGSRTPRATICSRIICSLALESTAGNTRANLDDPQFHHAVFISRQRRQTHEASTLFGNAGERCIAAHDEVAAEGDLGDAGWEPDLHGRILQRHAAAIHHADAELIAIREAIDGERESIRACFAPRVWRERVR